MPHTAKKYLRFNVSAMMKACKQARVDTAIAHKSVQDARKTLDSVNSKKKRLENRVSRNMKLFEDNDRKLCYFIGLSIIHAHFSDTNLVSSEVKV